MDLRTLAARAIVQPVRLPEIERCGVEWSVLRLDGVDSAAPGNKLFKLAENFRSARAAGYTRLLSFGGAYSNHLHALAMLGAAQGFATIGIVRGEAGAVDNATLRDAQAAGMSLHFIDRATYRRKHEAEFAADLQRRFGPCYIIPEGGANADGVAGCRVLGEIIREKMSAVDTVVLPCATGSTLAGVVAGLDGHCEVKGIAVLKGGDFLNAAVQTYLQEAGAAHCTRWSILTAEHCGGYARTTTALTEFIDDFQRRSGIPCEPVYTGKMLYALYRRILAGEFAAATRVLALHTGGLQGARGFAVSRGN
jgi:1-aminocyclopropane-1-carboxylate deaminase/D-cysteine desulfhydrase-like pyridoxal-dependent ACC family enzyme